MLGTSTHVLKDEPKGASSHLSFNFIHLGNTCPQLCQQHKREPLFCELKMRGIYSMKPSVYSDLCSMPLRFLPMFYFEALRRWTSVAVRYI